MDRDTELMVRFAEGDNQAFVQLVELHRKTAVSIAFRFLGDHTEAEDLAQEAFVRVYKARNTYGAQARFSTWFYGILSNVCLNEARRRRRRPLWPLSRVITETTTADPEASAPESIYEREHTARVVCEAVQALPEKQRMAVILQRFECLSYQDIAAVLGCSVGGVDGLLSRAKASLRGALAEHFAED